MKVAFIGPGHMGAPMSRNILAVDLARVTGVPVPPSPSMPPSLPAPQE